jgi:effector-binding domain-containing protein
MPIEIHTTPFKLNIFGFGGVATKNDHTATAFRLSGRMWELLRSKSIANKGKNIWVYGGNNKVFAGVELERPDEELDSGLESLIVELPKHAYFKYVGPYSGIGEASKAMRTELVGLGYDITLPYVEIYGHWNQDESKLETELLMAIR